MKSRVKALVHAASGIGYCIRNEVNFRIQLFAAAVVIAAGILLRLQAGDWWCICTCIVAVLVAEAFNTAIEKLCDLYSPGYNPQIKVIKDVSAGAVLIAAAGSVVAGLFIFSPKIFFIVKTFF
jgi:diacylglycerol kinase (ATP)